VDRIRCFLAASLLALCFYPTAALGAFITTYEAELEGIINAGPPLAIDIRFNSSISVNVAATLLDIHNNVELQQVWNLVTVPANTVSMYFVDTIEYCGYTATFWGCAEIIGDDMVIHSVAAATAFGAELEAHELGHNLGLEHVPDPPQNLMNSSMNGVPTLTAAQVATIDSNLAGIIQNDAFGDFISITPIVLIAIPEPGTAALLALGLLVLARRKRRQVPSRASI